MGERGAGADVREDTTGWRAAHAFALLARGFWSGPTRGRAWFLSSALAGSVLLGIAANVVIAGWHRWFFDALEARRSAGLWQAAGVFPFVVAATAAIQVGVILSRETIQVRWREWLTGNLVDRWLARERFYRLTLGERGSNPEYRIADDVRMAIDPLIDFAIGLLNASVSALTFIGILWGVGGGLALGGLWIPAYMVLAALLYGTLASAATLWIGRTLPRRVAEKNEAEARFRFALMRLRENAEAVALLGGAEDERRAAHRRLAELVARWRAVVWQSGRLTWIVNGNAVLVPVVPLLLTTPKYLAGELTLGAVMQLATAFVQVQMAIAWLVENWRALANWLASARRVVELADALEVSPPAAAPIAPRRRGGGRSWRSSGWPSRMPAAGRSSGSRGCASSRASSSSSWAPRAAARARSCAPSPASGPGARAACGSPRRHAR
jgi:putative ATP-binding cassette transporter